MVTRLLLLLLAAWAASRCGVTTHPPVALFVVGMVAARPALGLDTGVSFDRSAVVLIFRLPGIRYLNPTHDGRPVFIALPYVFKQGERLRTVVDSVCSWPIAYAIITIEVNGVAAMVAEETKRGLAGRPGPQRVWNMLHTTAATKTAGYGAILGLLENGQLLLPRTSADLLRQLAGLKFEQGERGFMKIEAESAVVHDDVADALMLAACPFKSRSGRIATGLSRWADPQRAYPEAELPPGFDGEVIETGSGLRVFRNPPLQSVNGPELTLPSNSERSATEASRVGPYELNIGLKEVQ